jgi:hypothetical protein
MIRTGGPRLRKDGKPDMRFKLSRDWAAFFSLPIGAQFTVMENANITAWTMAAKR